MITLCRIELHSHTDISNIRLLDSLNKVGDLIQQSADMGLKGIAITDHESVGAHVKAIQTVRKKKEQNEIPDDFKLILGNEIYLVDSLEEVKDNYKSGITKFPHFLLLAKDKHGHEALRILSSKAWENSFYTGTMERVPTIKEDLIDIVKKYPNKLVGTSSCIGSESSIHILNGDYDKAKEFLTWCSELFGKDNFYLELQPGADGEQRIVNEWLVEFSKELNLELIITNDVHYLRPEDSKIHEAFLNAKQGDREVSSFYANTYLHTKEEIYEKLNYIDKVLIDEAFQNTLKIGGMIEDYTIEHETIIPKIKLPNFEVKHLFKKGYDTYKYIYKMAHSENEQDRYLVHLLENGFLEYIPYQSISKEKAHQLLERIDIELKQLWELTEKLNQTMSSYYITVAKVVDLMWGDDDCNKSRTEGTLVGSGRGSAVAWVTNYLLGITQVNPLEYGIEIPYWRHLTSELSSVSSLDIDLDINGTKKQHIFKRIKKSFGEDRFLQVCTYGTEGSKSAIQTACRGLGIDLEVGQYLSSLIKWERGENWSIKDSLYGNVEKERKPNKEFINEIEKHPNLKKTALKIEGLINKRSIHAGGVLIMNDSYHKINAAMRAPNGTLITQYNLDDSQAMGGIKYDILTIESLQKIQTTMDLLLDEDKIKWQGSLRKTFNKYLHPEVIDKENPKLFEMAGSGQVADLFQFSTAVGHSTITKAKPSNLIEMTASNSIMRLQTDGEEQPIDTFVKHKDNISLWYDEMKKFGLSDSEVKIMEEHLLVLNGVADTQESVMLMSMDERIAGFTIEEATFLRKTIARKSDEAAQKAKSMLLEKGRLLNTSEALLSYVWYQISRMLSYAFSLPHTLAYSLIAMEQLNLNYDYSPIYWQTAVLTVNSGSQEVDEGEKTKSTEYGKMASAIADMKSLGVIVEQPLINSANFSFTPDATNNRIIFSLKGISTVGDETVKDIVANRPYSSFDDFYERMYKTKKIQRSQMLNLIKAGCFNEFNTQIEIMKQFLVKEVDVKTMLNGQNLSRVISLGLLNNDEYRIYQEYYHFRNHLKKKVYKTIEKPKNRIFALDDEYSKSFFNSNFSDSSVVGMGDKNELLIDEKIFEKEYKSKMETLTNLLKDTEFIRKFNQAQFYELWSVYANGTVPSWQMEAVSYYADKHELEYIDYNRYGVSNFFKLSSEPIVTEEYEWRGRQMKNFKLSTIVGTVLDKDKNSHTVTILTPEGVVTCKQWGGSFSHYDRQIKKSGTIAEKSWFTRGNLLMLTGYRRDDQFVLKAPKGQHTIAKITKIREDGSLGLQTERNF